MRKLLGSRFYAVGHSYTEDKVNPWADRVGDMFSSIPDNLNGAVRAFNTSWQTVMIYACVSIALRLAGLLFTSITLNVFGAILAGMGVVALQAEYIRREFISTTKKEFAKYLPQIVEEQWQPIYRSVRRCFEAYEEEAIGRIDTDIQSRKGELTNLLKQKESQEINREKESDRLKNLETTIASELKQIELLF